MMYLLSVYIIIMCDTKSLLLFLLVLLLLLLLECLSANQLRVKVLCNGQGALICCGFFNSDYGAKLSGS